MNKTPKISVLAPAYQAEKFIQRYIDCVLTFDYPNIELILVNDGSRDKTHEIIESNKERIVNAGIEFKYINLTENRGQAYAINKGLQEVSGEYLSWQDVDDIFFPNCLSRCYEIIKENFEYKIILNRAEVSNSYDLDKVIGYLPKKNSKNPFIDYLKDKGIYTVLRFVETEALFKVLKDKTIDTSRGGQNLQLLLPLAYKYKIYFLDEVLAKYVIYENSHSHSINKLKHAQQIFKIKIHTLDRIDMPKNEKRYYKFVTTLQFCSLFLKRVLLRISINARKKIIKIEVFGKEIFNSERIFHAK